MLHVDEYPSTSSDSSLPPELKNMDFDTVRDPPVKTVFGIDLGGTCTRAAIVRPKNTEDEDDGEPIVIKDIPSIASFLQDGRCLVGQHAEKRTIGSPLDTYDVVKRLIGRRYDDPVLQEAQNHVGYTIFEHSDGYACVLSNNRKRVFTPAQIEALILLKIKNLCEAEKNSVPVENIVITVPPYFDDYQIQVAKEAASIAGLNVMDVINTPIAAILGYSETYDSLQGNKIVAVIDLGGSSSSVTVLRVSEGATNHEMVSTVEDLFLGGCDFDKKLLDYLIEELARQTGIDAKLNPAFMQYLRLSAENAKKDLSYYTEIDVYFWVINLPGPKELVERITIKVTRNLFEQLVEELIEKTVSLCLKALKEANLSVPDVDEILAIGGTCKIPKIQATIQGIFDKVPIGSTTKDIDRANIVATGAALRAHVLKSKISNEQQLPDPPFSFPKPITEDEDSHYPITDNVPDETAITNNLMRSNIFRIYTDEEADTLVSKEHKHTAENSAAHENVEIIKVLANVIEMRRSREVRLDRETENQMAELGEMRDAFVRKELARLMVPKVTLIILE